MEVSAITYTIKDSIQTEGAFANFVLQHLQEYCRNDRAIS